MARRVAGILLLRIAGRDICRQAEKICKELLASIAKPSPRLMTRAQRLRCECVPSNLKKQNGAHRRCATGVSACAARPLIGANMLQAASRSIVALERRPPADCIREPVDSPMHSADNGRNPPPGAACGSWALEGPAICGVRTDSLSLATAACEPAAIARALYEPPISLSARPVSHGRRSPRLGAKSAR
jgi:hypothetical protein